VLSPWFRLHLLQLFGALLLATGICLLLMAPSSAGPAAPAACTTIPELQDAGLTSPCQGPRAHLRVLASVWVLPGASASLRTPLSLASR